MKRGIALAVGLLMFLAALLQASGEPEWLFSASEASFSIQIFHPLQIIPAGDIWRVARVSLNTTIFPKLGYMQRVERIHTIPNSTLTPEWVFAEWILPATNPNLTIFSVVRVNNVLREVKHKVPFPLPVIDKDVEKYLNPTQHINSESPRIRDLASSLAEGEDDAYELLVKLASWVHSHINYTAEGFIGENTLNSTWVLEHRRGACDEYSALFIALARALGIPSRYIVGVAYSENSQNPWESHGWVEAWLPVYGWIPFDPTYGEVGAVDLSHISFFFSEDVKVSPSILISEAYGARVEGKKPEISVRFLESKGKSQKLYSMKLEPYFTEAGLGSHNIIIATFNNSNPFYVADRIELGRTVGLKYLDDRVRFIVLRPFEHRKELFLVQTEPGNLSVRYIYTFPVVINSLRGYTAQTSFNARNNMEYYSYERIKPILQGLERELKESDKTLVREVGLVCSLLSNHSYVGLPLRFGCQVKNKGNQVLLNSRICLASDCKPFNLGIGETKSFEFEKALAKPGVNDLIFSLESERLAKSYPLSVTALAPPRLAIINLTHPESLGYKQSFEVSFLLLSIENSPVKDVNINVSCPNFRSGFPLTGFREKKQVVFTGRGRNLLVGENNCTITVQYSDLLARNYSVSQPFKIQLKGLSLVQKIPLWLRDFFIWFDGLFRH